MISVRAASRGVGDDASWVREVLVRRWGSTEIRAVDRVFDAAALPALIAELEGERAGLLTLSAPGEVCEVVTLDAMVEGRGVGTALLEAAVSWARDRGCARMVLTTSNDNIRALAFYQRRGWRMVKVHLGTIDEHRVHKPIPVIGLHGIPCRDEVEFSRLLG